MSFLATSEVHLNARGQVWWPKGIPADMSVCTTNILTVTEACCPQFSGVSRTETRPENYKSDPTEELQINCMSSASPDDWDKCAKSHVNATDAKRMISFCNDQAKVLNKSSSGLPVRAVGILSVVSAAAIAVLSVA